MSDTTEEVKVEAAEEAVEVPAKFKKFVDEIEKMTVIELNELVKVFEKKFGVSASAVAANARSVPAITIFIIHTPAIFKFS